MGGPPSDLISPPDDLTDTGGPPADLIEPPPDLVDSAPDAGAGSAFLHGAERGLLPSLASLPGMGAGAEVGAGIGALGGPAAPVTVPVGTIVGALAGGFGAAYLTSEAQEKLLSMLPDSLREYIGQSAAQRAAEGDQHPIASVAGELAPQLLTMRPGAVEKAAPTATAIERLLSHPVGARVVGAGLTGGTEAAQEEASGEGLSPAKIATATATGALLNKPTALGQRLERLGASVVPGARPTAEPGATTPPGTEPPPDAHDPEAAASIPDPGTVVGVRQKDGPPERGVIESTQDGYVFWRDEAGTRRVDPVDEFAGDLTDAPPPADVVRGDATTVPEPPPEAVETPPVDAYDLEAHLEPAPTREGPTQKQPSPQASLPLPDMTDVEAMRRRSQFMGVQAEKAKILAEQGSPQAKSPDAIAAMFQEADALREQADALQAQIAARSTTAGADEAATEAARQTRAMGRLGEAAPTASEATTGKSLTRPTTADEVAKARAGETQLERAAPAESEATTGQSLTRPRQAPAEPTDLLNAPQPATKQPPAMRREPSARPLDVLQVIRRGGGIAKSDPLAGDLGDAGKGLIRKNGKTLDQWRASLQELGYLPPEDPNAPNPTTAADVVDLIHRAHAGEDVFAEHGPDQSQIAAYRERLRYEEQRQRAADMGETPETATPAEAAPAEAAEPPLTAAEPTPTPRETELRDTLSRLGEEPPANATLEDLEAALDERLAMMNEPALDAHEDALDRAVDPDVVQSASKGTRDGDIVTSEPVPDREAAARQPPAERLPAGEQRPEPDTGTAGPGEAGGEAAGAAEPAARAAPRTETVRNVEGATEQHVIPGTERSARQAQAARDAKRGLASDRAQKAADEGLFEDRTPDRQGKLSAGIDPVESYHAVRDTLLGIGRAIRGKNGEPASAPEVAARAADSARVKSPPNSLARLGTVGRYISFASGLASRDSRSAALFNNLLNRDRTREMLERSAVPQMKPYMDLPEASRQRVNRVLEHDRIAGIDRKDTGRRVVLKVEDKTPNLELSKPGDVIALSPEETAAFHATRQFLDQRLTDLGASMAREQGYTGEFSKAGIDAAVDAAGDSKAEKIAARAAQIWKATEDARRSGYVPFSRYGDYYIQILPKPSQVPGKDAATPRLEDGRFEFVDTATPFSSLISERAGRNPKKLSDRLRELEQQYPRSKFDYEVGQVSPKTIQSLDIPAIEKLFAAVNFHDPKIGAALYDEVLKQVYNERMAGFRKASRNIPGYSTDFERSLADYVRQSSSVIANMEHGRAIGDAYTDIEQHPDRNVRDFWKAHKNHIENGKSDFAPLRQYGFFQYLWGSPSSALVNLTQTPLVTGFQLGSWAGHARAQGLANGALMESLSAIRPTSAKGLDLDYSKIGKTPQERAMLQSLVADGALNPSISRELQGADLSRSLRLRPAARALQRVYDIGASMFTVAEQANRAAAALAYFRAAQDPAFRARAAKVYKNDALWQEMVGKDLRPENIARFGVDETQFIGGKLNRQPIQRGVGSLAFQFQQYNANYMRLLYKNFTRMGFEGKMAGALMLTALVGSAGLLGIPFGQDALTGAQKAYQLATGIDPLLERRFSRWMQDEGLSQYAAEAVLHGPSRSLTGTDLSTRIGMGQIVPKTDMVDFLGPTASATAGRAMQVINRYATGQPIGAAVDASQALIGKGGSDVLRGLVSLPEEGYSSQYGNPIILPSQMTGGEMAKRALGFQPSEFARAGEAAFEDKRLAENTKEASTRLLTAVARNLALAADAKDPARASAFEESADSLLRENADAFAGGGPDWSKVPPPMARTIKQRVQQYLAPEDMRAKGAPKLKREEMGNSPFLRQ